MSLHCITVRIKILVNQNYLIILFRIYKMIITDNKIKNLTYEELKELIKELYPIGFAEFISYCRTSKSYFYKISGNRRWNAILRDCGLKLLMNKPNSYTREDIMNNVIEFRDICKEKCLKFSSTSYRKFGNYSQIVVDKNFGGWNNLLKEIGIDNNGNEIISDKSDIKLEKDRIKDIVLKFEKYCIDNSIEFNSVNFKKSKPGISYDRAKLFFGNWKDILEYCGLYEKYNPEKKLYLKTKIGKDVIIHNKNRIHINDFKLLIDCNIKNNSIDNIFDLYELGFSKHNIIKTYKSIDNFSKLYPEIKIHVKSKAEEFLSKFLIEKSMDFIKEFPGPVINKKESRYDFYIPSLNLIIEIHGIQHYELNKKFHNSFDDFENRVIIDNIKMNWAKNNGYNYVIFPYDSVNENMLNKILMQNFEIY